MSHSWNTARLRVRPIRMDDASAILAAMECPQVHEMHSNQFHSPGDVQSYIQVLLNEYAKSIYETFGISNLEGGRLIGLLRVEKHRMFSRAEISYWIAGPYRGNGFATETVRGIFPFCFEELNLRRVQATVSSNPASDRVLIKAGFSYEGTLRAYIALGDICRDCRMYSYIRSDWQR